MPLMKYEFNSIATKIANKPIFIKIFFITRVLIFTDPTLHRLFYASDVVKDFSSQTKIFGCKKGAVPCDTKNLGEQAEQEFMAYVPNDDNRKFTELYNVQRLLAEAGQR